MLEFAHVADEESQSLMTGTPKKRVALAGAAEENGTANNICAVVARRFGVLLLLMLLQSLSRCVAVLHSMIDISFHVRSFELQRFADLLSKNIEITLFLTMLVGAGGNCSKCCDVWGAAQFVR
jgi:hypothetical protein